MIRKRVDSHVPKTRQYNRLVVAMYTHGSGSGHLTRVNAVYRGFGDLGRDLDFYVVAPHNKYLAYLLPGIRLATLDSLPHQLDLMVCDWRFPQVLASRVARERARCWFGLCRLGRIPRLFPDWVETVAIEPGVRAQHSIWPILSTFQRDMLPREKARRVLRIPRGERCVFAFENGCFQHHPKAVLEGDLPQGMRVFRSTCNPAYASTADVGRVFPIAPYLLAADLIIAGAGYNSTHETRTLAPSVPRRLLAVGGDDQHRRLQLESAWLVPADSAAPALARLMASRLSG